MKSANKPPYVQLQNPVSKRWVKLDTKTGRIVGLSNTKFDLIPVRKHNVPR